MTNLVETFNSGLFLESGQIPAHFKQFSMDSGVGSTCSVHPTGIYVKNIPLETNQTTTILPARSAEVVTPSREIMETDFGPSLLKSPGMQSMQSQSQEYVLLEEIPTTSTLTVKT